MTIANYVSFFLSLKTENSTKKELRVYNNLIRLFNDLKSRNFSDTELSLIENELELLDFKADTNRKVLTKKLYKFFEFLKTKFALIADGHHAGVFMALGMSFGMLFGVALGIVSFSIGMILGMTIGMVIGSNKDKKAKEAGLVLDFKSSETFFQY